MSAERVGKKAVAFDFDDTLFGREHITRFFGFVNGKLRPQRLPNLTTADITKLDLYHGRIDDRVKDWKERISFEAHARRRIFSGVRNTLERLVAEGAYIYGNTGRPNKGEWVDMTYEGLDREGIGKFFTDVAFTPEGIKTAVSKAHRLHQLSELYEEVEYYEDDPRTVRFLALVLPNIKINYIQHGTSGLLVSRQEIEAFPNVRRVAVFSK